MIFFWLFALVGFVTLDRLRRMNIRSTVLQHQFCLYALRDELREAAIKKQVNPQNWIFLYLDSSLAKTISVLSHVTLWRIFITALDYQRDENSQQAFELLQKEFSKPENRILKNFYDMYVTEVGSLLIDRHLTIKIALSSLGKAIRFGIWLHRKGRRFIEYQTTTPETSTLRDFVHAH